MRKLWRFIPQYVFFFFNSNSVLQFCHIGVKSLQLYGSSLGPKDITVTLVFACSQLKERPYSD